MTDSRCLTSFAPEGQPELPRSAQAVTRAACKSASAVLPLFTESDGLGVRDRFSNFARVKTATANRGGRNRPTDPCARLILRAWSALAGMRLAEGIANIDAIAAIDKEYVPLPSASLQFDRSVLNAIVRALNDDAEGAVGLVNAALTRYPSGVGHPATSLLQRFGHWKARRIDAFCELSRSFERTPGSRRDAVCGVLHLVMESAVELERLRLFSAGRLASAALELAESFLAPGFAGARLAATLNARVLYEQNQLDDADYLIRDRLAPSGIHVGLEGALSAHIVGARIAAARRQSEFAILLLSLAESLGEEWGWPRLVAASLAERVRILVEDGEMKEAKVCERRLAGMLVRPSQPAGDHHVARYVVLAAARLELATGLDASTVDLLRQMVSESLLRRECQIAAEARLLLACALRRTGFDQEARNEALSVIKIGANAGLYRTFLDGGTAVRELLDWVYGLRSATGGVLGELRPYVGNLLAGFPAPAQSKRSARSMHSSGSSLSPRERRIVELMSRGLSNKQIAKQLEIAPETVKSHAKHILLKLAAQTRAEAVSRALSLGMI